jgi:hypothetical protein
LPEKLVTTATKGLPFAQVSDAPRDSLVIVKGQCA